MKKTLLWLVFFILTIFIFDSCSCNREEKELAPIENYKHSNKVINHINNNYVENIVYIGLYELKIDSVTVNLYYLPLNLTSIISDKNIFIVNALIYKNFDKNYSIFVNSSAIKDEKLVLYVAHELIHLNQFNNNRLIIYNEQNLIKFDNRIYFTLETTYANRPWETEAFYMQNDLKERILLKLH